MPMLRPGGGCGGGGRRHRDLGLWCGGLGDLLGLEEFEEEVEEEEE